MSDIPIDKTLDDIRQDLYDRINEVQDEYQAKGWLPRAMNLGKGVVRGLIEIWAWGLFQLYSFLTSILKQAFPSSATGLWLDLHCRQIGVTRFAKTKATGTVYFMREGTSGNVPISAGKVVGTLPDATGETYRFITTGAAVLADGASEVAVAVEAVEYGSGANVTTGQISEIVTYVSGVDSVENRADWLISEGQDVEKDDALRERYTLTWTEGNGCTAGAYKSWARSVSGVKDAVILDDHPRGQGTVDVIVLGVAGIPTAGLLASVGVVVDENKPINDDVDVRAPSTVSVDVTCSVAVTGGDLDEIEAGIIAVIQAYFTYDGLDGAGYSGLGQDVTLDRLTQIVMNYSSLVKTVAFTAPATDLAVDGDGIAVLGSVAVSVSYADSI